ncbi:acyl-CoA dehydrogenase, partial [Leptolyngbya sp. FACHB-671]|nr:acyl-CoA dehydrogenase [Leptolyngbya sp. FACHB-671]
MTAHTIDLTIQDSPSKTHWLELVEQLGKQFAARSQQVDESDRFVFENYADLKAHGFVSLGVPQALGGAG